MLTLARASLAFPTSRLVYARAPGTEECPDQTEVRRAVATRLGYDPFFPSSDKTIVARIARDGGSLKGQVELVNERGIEVGVREFAGEAGKCDELVRAMALSISIAIDPKSAETYAQGPEIEASEPTSTEPAQSRDAVPTAVAPTSALPPTTAVSPPSDHASRAANATRPALDFSAGLGLLGSLRVAPAPTLGAFTFVRARAHAWSLGFEARATLPVSERIHDVPIRVSTYALGLSPCYHFGPAFACELTRLELLSASGTSADGSGGTSALLALGGRAGLEGMLTRSVGVSAAAEISALPWQAALRSRQIPLWTTPALAAGADLAVVLHF